MKIRYLLLGLMICVAGAGTINSSDGSFCGQNATPFLIFGHVWYESGSPCNNPIVSINSNGASWQAETRAGYGYYELILNSAGVSSGGALSFNATDATGFNITNHIVNQSDLYRSGVFEVNLTLESPPPTTSQPRAPFVVCGWVNYENGAPCDAPCVNITNLDTDTRWRAETQTGYSYYELLLDSGDVSVGDVLECNATDDVISNTTNHMITESDLYRSGVFDLNLTLPSAPPISEPSAILLIYGFVPYKNGTPCDSPYVVVTNLNTSEELIADNRTGESFYQLATSSAFAKAGDVLKVNASKNGTPVGDATHTVNRTEIDDGAIEVNLNQELVNAPDFTVTDLTLIPSEPLIGDLVTLNATILNAGAAGKTYVEFYDHKSISLAGRDSIITLPGAIKMRVRFVVSSGNITIYNEAGVVEELEGTGQYWTKWCDGGTIRIELKSENAWFIVDRYVALLANKSITLGRGNSTNVPAVWNLSDQYMGWATNGTHDITVRADPYNQVIESDETNNNITEAIDVNPSLDFAVTNISFDNNKPVLGDLLGINATIRNYGVGSGTAVVTFFYDNISTGDNVSLTNKTVTLNGTESKVVSASWQTGVAYGGARGHNITVKLDTPAALAEANETNNISSKQLFVNGTDLIVTRIEIPCGDDCDNYCYVGQDVHVTATIANIGAADATNFTVEFRNGTCSDDSGADTGGANFSKVHIDRLNSGESRNVPVIWNPAEPLNYTITASIPYDECTDNNEMNNERFEYAWVQSRYDFTVENVGVEPQRGVRRGESVNITATIGSIGHGGGNVSIAFFVNSTDYAGTCGERFTRIGTIDNVNVEVGETETVSIRWDVDVAGGCHLIAAVVNPDNRVKESNGTFSIPLSDTIRFRGETGNNVKTCTLQVTPNDLTITDLTLDPAEPNICEIVDVSAEIKNNEGDAKANSTVWFYMEQNISRESVRGERSWTHQQPEDVMMRIHFDYIKWGPHTAAHQFSGSVCADANDSQVYFYFKNEDGEMAKVSRINSSMPCTESGGEGTYKWKHWYDVWTEWSYGDTIEIDAPYNMADDWGITPDWISIDKYQVRLGNETVTLDANESMIYHGFWNASPPLRPAKYYRLMANVENRTRYTNETYLDGTDLAVTNIAVKPAVMDGDMMWMNATIENLGSKDATAFLVNFTEVYYPVGDGVACARYPHLELINTTRIDDLGAGNTINILTQWNVSIRDIGCEGMKKSDGVWCDVPYSWTEPGCDDYRIQVEVNPLENSDKEVTDSNDCDTSEKVHVNRSRDFNVTDLSFYVNDEPRDPSEIVVYDDLTLNATLKITDLLNKGGSFNVSFYIDETCDEHEIGNTTVAYPAGNATRYAEIEWRVENFDSVDIPGDHNITVVADPGNRTHEINELNNVTVQPIYVMASDLVLVDLSINPDSPVRGETASINVTLANNGDAEARNVNLTLYDWAERHIEDADNESGVGCKQIPITRDNATAMRLYLDLEVDGGRVYVNDSSGSEIVHYDGNFHGDGNFHVWTPWVLDNSTTVVVTDGAYARVSKVYYLLSSSIIDTSTHDLVVNETKKIMVDWNPSLGGERFVVAVVDPENDIIESNNGLVEFIQVQTADILVSNLSLRWLNGTEIGGGEIIKDGDDVRISANLTNIGVEDADSFNVRFLVDDLPITNEVEGLVPNESICVSANWSATVGDHLLKVEADYVDEIDETNETNNIVALERYVCGAELSGNTSWETLGLLGEILFEPDQPYDEDEVNITARITNSGYVPAENFSAAMFFGHTPSTHHKRMRESGSGGTAKEWRRLTDRSYADALYIYLNISISEGYPRLAIYDGNGMELEKVDRSCWVRVPGDSVRVDCYWPTNYGSDYTVSFYPVYPDNLSQITEVDVNSSIKLPPLQRNVSVFDYHVVLFIDPENKVPEDEDYREDNVIHRIMHVKPTRDFTVTNVTATQTNFSDLDTPTIIANVSNIGLRNGTAEVDFVDYEDEIRRYGYHFDKNLNPPYLPIPPEVMTIHRPGVDAIELHFNQITLFSETGGMSSRPPGEIRICDENGACVWSARGPDNIGVPPTVLCDRYIPVPGETAYIHIVRGFFSLGGYTTETEFHREDVRLNATKAWNESKNITTTWQCVTGEHTITVALDRDDKITEINESNNANSNLFHINASRDAAIVGINITPENPGDGDNVDITAVIANNGSNASFTVDLWANLTRNKPDPDESLPDADLTTDMGGDRIRYITLLEHANLTLAPGENTTVNATWNDISVAGSPKYHIIAIVDPTDEIDEMNESNNEIVKEIIPNYPDLTIGTVQSGGGVKPVVPIIEIGGVSGASDVTVRFDAYETEECTESVHGWDKCRIYESRASNMQVHFEYLDSSDDGYVIVNDCYSIKNYIEEYRGEAFAGVWSPWVEGDKVWIISMGGTTYAKIDEYRWGNVSDEQIDDLLTGGHEDVEIPWAYECPQELNVTVDPDNNITEINEDNNNETLLLYADLKAEEIRFVSPSSDKLSLDAEKFKIDGYITNGGGGGRNDIVYPVSDFNVTLEFRRRYQNGTIGDPVYNGTRYVEDPLCADNETPIRFEFDPSEELKVGGNYTVRLIADSSNDVCESSELYYPQGEYNNFTLEEVYVSNTSYTGGGELVNVAEGEVNGRVVYTVGDEPSCRYTGLTPPGGEKTVRYTGVIPDANIEFARIFVYWFMYHQDPNTGWYIPEIADIGVTFNNNPIEKAGSYSDTSIGRYNYGYGLYSYDVKDHITRGENVATVTNNAQWYMGVAAIGLLVVYEDEDEPFTKYWVNEGADIVMAENGKYPTGLRDGDCITTATFEDVKRDDTENVNASLLTVMGMYSQYSSGDLYSNPGDALEFNGRSIGSKIGTGYWKHPYPHGIALTNDRWEDVTDHLERGDNLAEIHSKGNYMMPNNAFLRLIFPPDLNVIDLTAPTSTVVGAHHSINVTIRNDGRSDAHDFNATLEIDGRQMVRIPHLDLAAGENMTLHLYNWTPMMLMHVYNLTAAADVLSGEDWTEIETENNAMTKYVPIEEGGFGNQTGPRGTGGGSNPTGGEYTETITGRVMEGTKFATFGGGGGAGMFSALEWIMKGAVWFVLVLFVGLGYRMEQRSYGRVGVPGYARGL